MNDRVAKRDWELVGLITFSQNLPVGPHLKLSGIRKWL